MLLCFYCVACRIVLFRFLCKSVGNFQRNRYSVQIRGYFCRRVLSAFIFFIKIDGPEKSQDVNVKLSERQKEDIKTQISAVFREQTSVMTQTVEDRTRDALEKLSNQKINELAEYSDTVLGEINKNHSEVMFLYDMLNDKHENLKNTVTEVEKTAKEVRQTVKDAEINAKELTVKEAALKLSLLDQTVLNEILDIDRLAKPKEVQKLLAKYAK